MSIFLKSITTRTTHGTFSVSTRDKAVGATLFKLGKYEDYDYSLRTLQFLRDSKLIPSNDVTMLDVGANIGVISIGLMLKGLINHAIAVEPEPTNFNFLNRNIAQNALSGKIHSFQSAVGEKSSTLTMELSPDNFGDHRIRINNQILPEERLNESNRSTVEVQSMSLPELLEHPQIKKLNLSPPTLMWIDVQGFEGYVFKGASKMLLNGIVTVAEIWPYGLLRAGISLDQFSEIVSQIWSNYWIERRMRFIKYPISSFRYYLEELGDAGYYENAIFTNK